jgi:hypothetical protein
MIVLFLFFRHGICGRRGRQDVWQIHLLYCVPDEILLCIQVALLCVQENPDDRPHMSSVVLSLENRSITLPKPNQPAYFAQRSNEMDQGRDNIYNSVNTLTITNVEAR